MIQVPLSIAVATADPTMPTEYDILCGKDKTYAKHAGNQRFRQLIDSYLPEYRTSTNKQDKMRITRMIVHVMRTRYNARFLKPVDLTTDGEASVRTEWIEITDQQARDKISHAIRFALNHGSFSDDGGNDNPSKTIGMAPHPKERKTHRRRNAGSVSSSSSGSSYNTTSTDSTVPYASADRHHDSDQTNPFEQAASLEPEALRQNQHSQYYEHNRYNYQASPHLVAGSGGVVYAFSTSARHCPPASSHFESSPSPSNVRSNFDPNVVNELLHRQRESFHDQQRQHNKRNRSSGSSAAGNRASLQLESKQQSHQTLELSAAQPSRPSLIVNHDRVRSLASTADGENFDSLRSLDIDLLMAHTLEEDPSLTFDYAENEDS